MGTAIAPDRNRGSVRNEFGMSTPLRRRQFLSQAATVGAILPLARARRGLSAAGPGAKIVVGVMGVNGRGLGHIAGFLSLPGTEVAYVCDVDARAIEKGIGAALDKQESRPRGVTDFRRILDDPDVDALSIAAPNHWHAPAAILACAAGKHVYVEKPGSHNPHEGELLVAAARRYDRRVQMGNQRRSFAWAIEAVARLRAGEIGRVRFARTWYNNRRPSIGQGRLAPVPDWLDYDLWQGPAPDRPYKDNLVHYNWHWHWHWGNGELGNNGIHALDLARWGLGVEAPRRVTCGGGRYHYNDDQETPDVYVTTFDFGDCGATWESHSCHPRGFEGTAFGVTFYGERGALVMAGEAARIYDLDGRLVSEINTPGSELDHFRNFLDAIRGGAPLNAEIAEGQKSALLCHLGNIAYRCGRALEIGGPSPRILGDAAAAALWRREYRAGWEPAV